MKVLYTVTDEDVRNDVETTVAEFECDGLIKLPDRVPFIDEVTELICDKYMEYESYTPDYWNEVYDLAKLYGYWKG